LRKRNIFGYASHSAHLSSILVNCGTGMDMLVFSQC
jgi:hypothetical protein